jgi:SPP1 family predicted phage head-tail adaptor
MRAGSLDHRITIQRKTVTQSPSGEPIETWTNVAMRRPAAMMPVRGAEQMSVPELVANEQTEFRVRYSASVAGLSPLDRVIYPALTVEQAADAS